MKYTCCFFMILLVLLCVGSESEASNGLILAWGDYDGDGIWETGIFRVTSGLWAIRGITRVYFGGSTDKPVPADYDGGSSTEIGIFRESSGLWAIRSISRVYFGTSGDIPVTR